MKKEFNFHSTHEDKVEKKKALDTSDLRTKLAGMSYEELAEYWYSLYNDNYGEWFIPEQPHWPIFINNTQFGMEQEDFETLTELWEDDWTDDGETITNEQEFIDWANENHEFEYFLLDGSEVMILSDEEDITMFNSKEDVVEFIATHIEDTEL